MTSFLVEKNTKRSFGKTIAKLAVKTQQNINADRNSFAGFCTEYYDGRSDNDIFTKLKTSKVDEYCQLFSFKITSKITLLARF
ncbi:MAG: hypothetical protein OEL52_01865 [Nitrosopumilus sp.]|nr:hypothetical protein [Nitrosopumilus sp.]